MGRKIITEEKGRKTVRILIADDEEEMTQALSAILKHEHYSVDTVQDVYKRQAQGGAALGEYCIVALGQAADEGISAGGFRCGPDAFRQNVLITVADIVPDAHAKQRRILKHHAEGTAQILQPVLSEIAAV